MRLPLARTRQCWPTALTFLGACSDLLEIQTQSDSNNHSSADSSVHSDGARASDGGIYDGVSLSAGGRAMPTEAGSAHASSVGGLGGRAADAEAADVRVETDSSAQCDSDADCELASSVSACASGRCRIVTCLSGFHDRDGLQRNGCESGTCRTLAELPIGSRPAECTDGNCGSNNSCVDDGNGGFVLHYALCRKGQANYAICETSATFDMTQFDASFGGGALLEVSFCLDEPSRGAVNLWYGQNPLRKFVPIVTDDETLAPDCYVRHFRSSDAIFPSWCNIPESCKTGCPSDSCLREFKNLTTRWSAGHVAIDEDCYERDASAGLDADADRPLYESVAAGFDLHEAHLQLVAEWCKGPVSGAVHLRTVRLLSPDCACSESHPCVAESDRPTCHLFPVATCAPENKDEHGACGPDGLDCSGPPGSGEQCTVTVDDQAYTGRTECADGRYVCKLE